ncbi:MAG: ABC transporter permease [Symbiobacteriaceae bacterium]|nr:ABC transporter permease [Symbiobacteriaceae bacterium]
MSRKSKLLGRPSFYLSPALWPLIISVALFIVLPIIYIVNLSFLQRGATWGVTDVHTLEAYRKLADPTYFAIFANSLRIATLTTLACLVLGYPFAYTTASLPPGRRQLVLLLLLAPFWLNSLIRLNGWILFLRYDGVLNNLLLKLGVIREPLRLLHNQGAILLGMVYGLISFMILAIYNSVEKLDRSLLEAARDLGASPLRAFLTVTLPLTLPGIIAGSILVFVPSIGLFFISDLLGGGKDMLLGNLIATQLLSARNWPFGAVLSVVMLLITVLLIRLYRVFSGGKSIGEML